MGKVHKEIAMFMVNGAKGDQSNEQLVTVRQLTTDMQGISKKLLFQIN